MIKKAIIGIIATFISSGALLFSGQPDGLLHVYFLNIGQGDSIFIQTPRGHTILVDGGPERNVLSELKEILPFFNAKIDYLVSTHPDKDHVEGLIWALKKYPVRHVMFTGAHADTYFSKTFLEQVHEKNIPLVVSDENADVHFDDGVVFDVLYPRSQFIETPENTNTHSLIAQVDYGKNKILLTGDADFAEENKMLAEGISLDSDVLKVSHHGSKNGSSEAFLKAVLPEWSIISVGAHNNYHHPHPSLMKRLEAVGAKIFRTDQDGRVEFVFSPETVIRIRCHCDRSMSAPSARSFSSSRS